MIPRRSSTGGFTLIESLVAIVLLSLGALALGGLLATSSRLSTASASSVHATATLTAEVNRLNTLPFANLAAGNACDTVTAGHLPRIRCTSVTDLSSTLKQVRVIVTPTANSLRPDTVVFQRTQTSSGNPLNTP